MDGHSFVSWVEITKDMMTASQMQVATEFDVSVANKQYTVQLKNYQPPSLTIIAGSTIRITGDIAGNTVYATKIETIQKPKTTKYVLMRAIASPEQEKAMNAAK